jgi:hypothetical protein
MGIFNRKKKQQEKEEKIKALVAHYMEEICRAKYAYNNTTRLRELEAEFEDKFWNELKVSVPKELREYYEKSYNEAKKDNQASIEQTKSAIAAKGAAQRKAIDEKYKMLDEIERTGKIPTGVVVPEHWVDPRKRK